MLVGLTDKPLAVAGGTAFSCFQQQIRGTVVPDRNTNSTRRHRLDFGKSISDILPPSEAVAAVDRLHTKQGTRSG